MSESWHEEKTYEGLISLGQDSLKMGFLLNGGGIIAILTFVGNILKSGSSPYDMSTPLSILVVGIICNGSAVVCGYIMQLRLFEETQDRRDNSSHYRLLNTAVILVVLSLLCFSAGSYLAVDQLSNDQKEKKLSSSIYSQVVGCKFYLTHPPMVYDIQDLHKANCAVVQQ